jgi:hypothetical protein
MTMITEAEEIAIAMLGRAGSTLTLASMDEARTWVKLHWPEWKEFVGEQMLDNVAEAVWNSRRT